jgi:peptide/nickel transport system ATP-binding protein
MLDVKSLTKRFSVGLVRRRKIEAVKNVSFEVRPAEFVSLVGESGSGKTTTARMILKLLKPTAGSVLYNGKDIWRLRNRAECMQYWREVHGVFQDPFSAYNPFYKVDRVLNQAFSLLKDRTSDRERTIRESLKQVGLNPQDVLGKYPHELSGGQKQRLMISRCYILRPKVIIADEPISMIDASTRAGVLALFSRLRDEFKTSVVFITHDLGLAYYASDKVIIMHNGVIVEEGSPEEITSRPQNDYTRRLMKDVPLLYQKWDGF